MVDEEMFIELIKLKGRLDLLDKQGKQIKVVLESCRRDLSRLREQCQTMEASSDSWTGYTGTDTGKRSVVKS